MNISTKCLRIVPVALAIIFALVISPILIRQVAYAATDKSVSHCLGVSAFPLNDLCVTTHYTVFSSTNALITSVDECIDVMGPAAWAVMKTHLDVYNQGPKVLSQDGPTIPYGPILAESNKCISFQLFQTVMPGYVGVWIAAIGSVCDSDITTGCSEGSSNPPTHIGPIWVDNSDFT